MGELNKVQEKTIYTLTRGRIASEFIHIDQLQEILFDDRPEVKESDKLEAIASLCEFANGRYYDGIFYRVLFRTNHSINLQSLGFWGPNKEATGMYKVNMVISKLSTLCIAKQILTPLSKLGAIISAKRREIFFVKLDNPVHVAAGHWTQIEFSLNGPPTAQSMDIEWGPCLGEGGVTFDFSSSSRQLPVIKYEICHTCEVRRNAKCI